MTKERRSRKARRSYSDNHATYAGYLQPFFGLQETVCVEKDDDTPLETVSVTA
jgi:hypothetical protein